MSLLSQNDSVSQGQQYTALFGIRVSLGADETSILAKLQGNSDFDSPTVKFAGGTLGFFQNQVIVTFTWQGDDGKSVSDLANELHDTITGTFDSFKFISLSSGSSNPNESKDTSLDKATKDVSWLLWGAAAVLLLIVVLDSGILNATKEIV